MTSLLVKTNLTDVLSIRRIMVALQYYLTHLIIVLKAPELINLTMEEEQTVDRIIGDIRNSQNNHLLLIATLNLIFAQDRDDANVLAAATTFDTIGNPPHILLPRIYPEEYAAAEQRFLATTTLPLPTTSHLLKTAPGAFHAVIISTAKAAKLKSFAHEKGFASVAEVPLLNVKRIYFGLPPEPATPAIRLFDDSEDDSGLSDPPESPVRTKTSDTIIATTTPATTTPLATATPIATATTTAAASAPTSKNITHFKIPKLAPPLPVPPPSLEPVTPKPFGRPAKFSVGENFSQILNSKKRRRDEEKAEVEVVSVTEPAPKKQKTSENADDSPTREISVTEKRNNDEKPLDMTEVKVVPPILKKVMTKRIKKRAHNSIAAKMERIAEKLKLEGKALRMGVVETVEACELIEVVESTSKKARAPRKPRAKNGKRGRKVKKEVTASAVPREKKQRVKKEKPAPTNPPKRSARLAARATVKIE